MNGKDRKSIVYWHGTGHTAAEMATWRRFRHLAEADIQSVIDAAFPAEPPAPTAEDRKDALAAALFPGSDEWERGRLLDDLVSYVKGEL